MLKPIMYHAWKRIVGEIERMDIPRYEIICIIEIIDFCHDGNCVIGIGGEYRRANEVIISTKKHGSATGIGYQVGSHPGIVHSRIVAAAALILPYCNMPILLDNSLIGLKP